MTNMYYKVLLLQLILITVPITSVSSLRLCGSRLSDALQLICQHYGGYHTHGKRDTMAVLQGMAPRQTPENLKHHIMKRGVVDECCKSHCSFYTLSSYCAHPAGENFNTRKLAWMNML